MKKWKFISFESSEDISRGWNGNLIVDFWKKKESFKISNRTGILLICIILWKKEENLWKKQNICATLNKEFSIVKKEEDTDKIELLIKLEWTKETVALTLIKNK